jgi:glycosyltransferase involved in cell wall biosynthesis
MLPGLEQYCRKVELVPFEGFSPLSTWRNRVSGWSGILLDRRPRYVHTYPVAAMRRPLDSLLDSQDFDIVVFELLFLVELLDVARGTPVVLVEQNVESDIARRCFEQATNPVHKLRDWLMWRKLLAFERQWVRRFPVCVAVSGRDAAILRAMSPDSQVHVVPNGVDCEAFAPAGAPREPETLLFFGTLSYGPNAEGLVWFCDTVLPKVRALRPNVRLRVVGLDPPPRVMELGRLPGVDVVGFVPDVRPELWSAALCVVPLHIGGGTRLKILEALAAGCPVISTTVGAEGLSLAGGEHLLLADDAEDFACRTVEALESADLRRRLAQAGRKLVVEQYDWSQIALKLESACVQAVRRHRPA